MTAFRSLLMLFVLLAPAGEVSAGFRVLTVDKVVRLANRGDAGTNGGVVTVGRDRELATPVDPRCPATSSVSVEAYLQSTYRDQALASTDLDCTKWRASRGGFVYGDPAGTVRSIRYGPAGLRIEVRGPGYTPIGGPVGYVQAQLTIGSDALRVRFHNFRRNDASTVVSRKPSAAAAAGEAGFWDALLGDGDADEAATLGHLAKAARHDRKDGRSRFLLAMLHLYRFGRRVTDFTAADDAARAELAAANAWFAKAVPLLWDDAAATGDSRVPGFAAAAEFLRGVVENDAGLRAAGLADLDRAVHVNAFFNVFDYIPVIQAAAPGSAEFQAAFTRVTAYLTDPETLACVRTQPEICNNFGFAPHTLQGSLVLFGDVFAKAGDLDQARIWYTLASLFPDTQTWRFKAISDDRLANAAPRVALYTDADPANDPPVIGTGAEACAVCHTR